MTANNDALREAVHKAIDTLEPSRGHCLCGHFESCRNCEPYPEESRIAVKILRAALAASKPEPQAQAGEPEGLKFCLVLPETPKAKNFRRQQRRDGGYDMVPAYTEEELCAYGEICCADLQKQLDAMRHARDLYKSEADAIEAMRRESIAKKDAALRACVEALEKVRRVHRYCEDPWYSCPKHEDGCANEFEGPDCNCGADEDNAIIDYAITQANEALK